MNFSWHQEHVRLAKNVFRGAINSEHNEQRTTETNRTNQKPIHPIIKDKYCFVLTCFSFPGQNGSGGPVHRSS